MALYPYGLYPYTLMVCTDYTLVFLCQVDVPLYSYSLMVYILIPLYPYCLYPLK